MMEEKLEEGELLVGGRGKDVDWGLANSGHAKGEEVACDVDVAIAQGSNKAFVEEGACAR